MSETIGTTTTQYHSVNYTTPEQYKNNTSTTKAAEDTHICQF